MKRLVPEGTARQASLRAPPAGGESPSREASGTATTRANSSEVGALAWDPEDLEPSYLGWEIARCAPGLAEGDERALAGLAAALVLSMRAGSTRLPLRGDALSAALAAVGFSDALAGARVLLDRARAAAAHDPVTAAIGHPGDRKPLIVDGPWLYAERMHALEERFCARVARVQSRTALAAGALDGRALARVVAAVSGGAQALTDEQKRAVRQALGAPLALVTGGPGTGKTATAVAIVRAFAWMGMPMEQLAIAAPTGKAAQRLADAMTLGLARSRDLADAALPSIVPTPLTLHRLLGWSPSKGRFARHENDPLPHRVVVVDEASMIDLAMMDRLLRALREDARLILLGDADQLPSIEAGAVFRDLCTGLGGVRLSVNLRVANDANARRIIEAAQAVNSGVVDARFAEAVNVRNSVREVVFEGVEHLAERWSTVGDDVLDRWWRDRIAVRDGFTERASRVYRLHEGAFEDPDRTELRLLFDDHAKNRILCVTRVRGFATGADVINDRLVARLRGETSSRFTWRRARAFAPGTLVSVQRNDYERGLYNGDQGVVVRVASAESEEPSLRVVFLRGDAFESFPVDVVGDLAPAFAMTVHKSQGSEFDHVAVVLPEVDLPLLTRELLYTAMTRARRSVLLIGQQDLLVRAVSRAVERFSGVAERLKKSG